MAVSPVSKELAIRVRSVGGPKRYNDEESDFDQDHMESDKKSLKSADIEDALIDPSYAVSPMKPFRHFLNLGTLVGVFPADSDERLIHFALVCSLQVVWAVVFTILWLGLGIGVATYCCIYNSTSGLSTVFQVKTDNVNMTLTSTDQLVVMSTPWMLVGAWFTFLILGWTRIDKYGDLCSAYCSRGFQIGSYPEKMTLIQFAINYVLFVVGQTIANIHIALIYCPDEPKQIIFSIVMTIWMLPLYTVIVFSGYVFMQFCRTLSENFKKLRTDIGIKSKQVQKRNVLYAEVIKRGLPRRYDRLHDNLELLGDVFDIVLFFEYFFYVIALLVSLYLSISSLIIGVKTKSIPWWMCGYTLLILHYILRMYQLASVGYTLKDEMQKVLTMMSQFAFIHGDTNLLCLTLLRRPQEPPLSLAGFASLQRSLVAKTLAFVLVVMLLVANFKLDDYDDLDAKKQP